MLINADLQVALIGREELVRRVKWYIRLRWIFLVSLSIIGVFSDFLIANGQRYAIVDFVAFGICLFLNLVLYILSKTLQKPTSFVFLALTQLLFDIFISCYVVYIHGGIQSRTIILYAIPIVMAGALFGSISAYIAAFLSALLYSLTLFLGLTGWESQYVITSVAIQNNVFVPILFYTIVFFIFALLGDFVSGINERTEQQLAEQEAIALASHQLRTPATAVKGFLATLMDDTTLSAKHKIFLMNAFRENERELQLIETMLLVAQADSQALKPERMRTDLVGLVDDAIAEHSAGIEARKQRLSVHKPETLSDMIDPRLMRIVIDNLLDNAIKYTPDGGTIDIILRKADDQIEFIVKDSGIGIAKKDLHRLFKRYSRIPSSASHNAGGFGLGLYLTKKILDIHQGTITVKSVDGQGTIFKVKFRSQEDA